MYKEKLKNIIASDSMGLLREKESRLFYFLKRMLLKLKGYNESKNYK